MNSKIDYKTIPDLVDKEILSQDITFKDNSKIVKTVYLNKKNQQVILTQTLMKKAVLERRNWAKFGAAKISNDGISTVGAEVFIEPVNKPNTFNKYPIPNKIVMKKPLLLKEKFRQDRSKETQKYVPRNRRNGDNKFVPRNRQFENNKYNKEFVVCVKNIPSELTSYDLKDIGYKYGNVARAHVLNRNKGRHNDGIGFIHYNSEKEQETAIDKLHRTNIGGHMLIHAEKASRR
jgi:hypothetical protein